MDVVPTIQTVKNLEVKIRDRENATAKLLGHIPLSRILRQTILNARRPTLILMMMS
jgi:hypothetical protein